MLQTPATVASDGEECSVQPCEDYRPPNCTSEDQPDPEPVNNDIDAQITGELPLNGDNAVLNVDIWNLEDPQQSMPINADTFTDQDWTLAGSAGMLEMQVTTNPKAAYKFKVKPMVDQTGPRLPTTNADSQALAGWWSDPMQHNVFFSTNRPFLGPPATDSSHPSLTFPRYCSPVSYSDKHVCSFIEEGRRELQQGHFEARTAPTLKRLLSDPPFDCLSFRLLQFIKRYGAVPLQNLLFTFWVQYLFLRWQILGTSESYYQMPVFMRPSALECIVPHRPFIGMLVWPNLRQALIRDTNDVDAELIGTHLFENLSRNWAHDETAFPEIKPGTMDLFDLIQQQACTLDVWKVNPAFFSVYPQYVNYLEAES
ncbi:uncharacterized protein AB675_1782 [Cyphellophora attinorum]|uniref:Uncharacterized protein n=1 Tax=Cyphellophora attinorum TaxID=1664694 RepID=A0A0N1HU55_9EURO|nr:uncharacterized protein AB675_1782 [Phialophora attinorum]KPI42814.1 hypothetical protein AB675_1782 [Phialophora attinorum]